MSKVIKLGQYKDIAVEVERTFATQEEVESEIAMILEQSSTYEDKEGLVENGDMTTIDFEGFKDGVAFEGGKGENYQLLIGSNTFIPGFESQMIGMAKGETKDLNVTFPENYGASELAGVAVVFKVTVHNIQKEKKAVLSDEFVASFNVANIDTVEAFRARILEDIQKIHDQKYNEVLETKVFDQVVENCEVEVDEADIERGVEKHVSFIRMQLATQGMPLEQYLEMLNIDMEAFKEQLKPNAIQQIKFEAIVDEIAEVENLVVSDEEIDAQLEMIAQQNNVTKEEVLEQLKDADLKRDHKRLKATQFILENIAK